MFTSDASMLLSNFISGGRWPGSARFRHFAACEVVGEVETGVPEVHNSHMTIRPDHTHSYQTQH